MNDEKIYEIVKKYLPYNEPRSSKKKGSWEFAVWEPLEYKDKIHRLIACFHERKVDFLGIVHCYRIKKSKYEKKINNYPFPSVAELEKVRKELSDPNYSRVNFVLGDNATPLEKSKYEICQNICCYKRENKISDKEIGKKLGIKSVKRLECLFFSHISEFTLDELVEYASKLFAPFHLEMIPEKSLLFLSKTTNSRLRKRL